MRIISAKFTKHSRPFFGVPNNVPLRLFHQLEQLQKALFRCAVEGNPFVAHASSLPIRVFAVEQCRTEWGAVEGSVPDAPVGLCPVPGAGEEKTRPRLAADPQRPLQGRVGADYLLAGCQS